MLTLPADLIVEKNKVASTSPWLILLETTIPSTPETDLYLVRNTEDIVYNSQTYTAFPFEVEAVTYPSKGELSTLILKVCNINRVMQSYVEDYDGLVDKDITLKIVSKPEDESDYLLALTVTYDIIACTCDGEWVRWELGAPNPLYKRFPLYRYIASHCNWAARFNQVDNYECGIYSAGSTITCNGTLARCQEIGVQFGTLQSEKYGGFIGLGKGNVRLV